MDLKALIEKRNDLQEQMAELLNGAKTEERAMSEEEVGKFDSLEKEIKDIDETICRAEKVKGMEKKEVKKERADMTQEERDIKAFANYVRSQVTGIEERDDDVNLTKGDNGAVIPSTIINKIIGKVEDICPIYARSNHYRMKGTISIPKEDESTDAITVAYANEFEELTSHSNKFGSIELTGFLYGALTKISKSLLKNSDFNLTEFVVNKMSKKIAKFIEGELLNGTANKSSGIARSYDSTNMKKTLAANNAITTDELIDAQELIPDVYQTGCIWIMNKATRTAIRKLKDDDGNYLLNKDVASTWGYTLLGHDVYCSDNVSALGTGGKNVVYYGDFSGLAVKEAETSEIQILTEKYATQHAIGVVAWGEIDSKVEDVQKIAVIETPSASV